MRNKLERFLGQRIVVRARFRFFGTKMLPDGRIVRYMLIEDIRDERDKPITPHMWMQLRASDTITVPMVKGDTIQFSAQVNRYAKGNKRRPTFDYGLIRPRDVQVIQQHQEEAMNEQQKREHPGWQVLKGLRQPLQKKESWPRLFRLSIKLKKPKVRANLQEASYTLYGTYYTEPYIKLTLADGQAFSSLNEMKERVAEQGEFTLTWQDGEVEEQ